MDFRAAIIRTAADVDLSVDPASPDAEMPAPREQYQPPPETDGQDPATPGGPAPMNGADPAGAPVADDPLLPEPQRDQRSPMPYTGPGADVDTTTLHSASLLNLRQASYENKRTRRS